MKSHAACERRPFCCPATDFLFFWGTVFLVSTTLVAIFKRETERGKGKQRVQEETQGVMETYRLLLSIIKMPTVFTFCVLLLTAKVCKRGFGERLGVWLMFREHLTLVPPPIPCVCFRWASLQPMQ